MRQQLKLLEELQRHDARLQEYESALKSIPEKLQSMRADLAKVEALLQRERQALAETEAFHRDLDGQLKLEEGNIAKAKAKLQQVKGGKEYMAAQREIEATRKIAADRQEEILKLIEAIEASKKSIAAHEEDVAQLRAHVEQEEVAAQGKVAEVEAKAAEERTAREEIAVKVDKNLLKRYGSIRIRRGLAVVPVVRGSCQGCHMAVPPQLYNMLQRGNSIETCPSCQRLIYWDELMKEQALEEGERKA